MGWTLREDQKSETPYLNERSGFPPCLIGPLSRWNRCEKVREIGTRQDDENSRNRTRQNGMGIANRVRTKMDGLWRLCVKCITINYLTAKEDYHIQRMDE